MASGVIVLVKARGLLRVIVCAIEKRLLLSNVTVFGAAVLGGRFSGLSLKLTFAQATAEGMLPYPLVASVVVTRYDELAS